ncbi:hypothetical protein J1614_003123 [Plenodomus biglobosus]|nr:hypothetical protein J1614_003123 [Plenodomus biglobosus]
MGSKRRKISLFETDRARNGGADDSFIDPNNANLDIPSGSDTEPGSESEEVAQNMGGAIHADPNDETKKQLREIREKAIWGEDGKDAAEMRVGKAEGAKRKRNGSRIVQGTADTKKKRDNLLYPTLPADLLMPLFPHLPTHIPLSKPLFSTPPHPSAPSLSVPSSLPPLTHYPPRNPTATRFHHSSAAIDPAGA